jgi:hypothetical protein
MFSLTIDTAALNMHWANFFPFLNDSKEHGGNTSMRFADLTVVTQQDASIGNASDLYSNGAQFESQSEYQPS